MSEQRERVFRMALVAVLQAGADKGLNIDTLSEAAIESMLDDVGYVPEDVAQAAIAIEVAADAVHQPAVDPA